jgi:8-oxo-dGTP pyrophosphatase MutT (NUDIX family)
VAVVSTPAQTLYPAATVVVVRDATAEGVTPSLETLMLRRNDRGTFGGMWVFPGGRVDPGDADLDAPDDELAAARRAAAREAMEEAAVVIDPGEMVPLSHWRPPASVPKGYATWFFVAAGSDAAIEVDGTEIHDHAWLAPAEVLRRRDAGEVTLAPPTFVTLTMLAEHDSVAELLAAVRALSPERFRTQIGDADGTATAYWHGDESYGESPGAAGARHRLVMADGAWRYERG